MNLDTSSGIYRPYYIADSSIVTAPEPNPAPRNVIDFIAVAQKLQISFLGISWQVGKELLGEGASGSINQALVTLHTSLAFKCVKKEQKSMRSEDDIFRALINEIIAFSQPANRRNRGVLNLEGICLDIETSEEGQDKIWPTLVFEKSQYGDLATFLTQSVGRKLSFKERVFLCMDVAWAMSDMHMHEIVHGDMKHQNVLVFRNDKRYTAKVTDFGLSPRETDKDDRVFVAGTQPWTAPELKGNYFTIAQAKNMDIFSYGMLAFWILFEKYFSGNVPLPAGSCQIDECFEGEQQQTLSMPVFERLKHGNKLNLLAKKLVRNEQSIDDNEIGVLEGFFDKALSCDPEDRVDALGVLFPFREHHRKFPVDQAKLEELDFHPSECKFELMLSAMDFYSLDYRIRRCIRQLLEQRKPDADTAFQLALCNYIGFGGPREEESLNMALHSSGRTREELEDAVASMRPFDRVEKRYTGKVLYALEKSGDVFDSTPSAHHTLMGAETAIRHELRDLESSLGKSSRLWLFSAGQLAWMYEHLNRWQNSEELRKELVLLYKALVPEDSSTMLLAKQNLARTFFHLGRHQDAQELQKEVVDSHTKSLGKSAARTLQSLDHLAFMYEDQKQWEQAKELEVYVMDERKRTLGEEHELTLHNMGQLASIYHKQGLWEESRELWVRVVEISKRALGDKDPTTLVHTNNLARAYRDRGYLNEAKELQEQTYRISNKVFGERHPRTLHSLADLARTLWKQGAYLEAESLLRQALALNGDSLEEEKFRWIIMTDLRNLLRMQEERFGASHPNTLTMRSNLAEGLNGQKKWEEAQQMHQDILASRLAVLGANHSDTLRSMVNLSNTLSGQGKHQEALQGYEKALETYRDTLGPDHPHTLACEKHCHRSRRQVSEQTSPHLERENAEAGSGTEHDTSRSEPELTKMMQDGHL